MFPCPSLMREYRATPTITGDAVRDAIERLRDWRQYNVGNLTYEFEMDEEAYDADLNTATVYSAAFEAKVARLEAEKANALLLVWALVMLDTGEVVIPKSLLESGAKGSLTREDDLPSGGIRLIAHDAESLRPTHQGVGENARSSQDVVDERSESGQTTP